jgi:ankyrin repeat/BTB/POZ domain-containing protein 1
MNNFRLLETGELSDVTFIVNGSTFHVHRCVLAARCVYFRDKFETKWPNRRVISIKNSLVNYGAKLLFLNTQRTLFFPPLPRFL